MESESYSQLLQKLADAMEHWADWLPGDRDGFDAPGDVDFQFHEIVDIVRLDVLANLGAERRSYLAELVDAALNRAVEAGEDFVAACDDVKPPTGVQFWQDVALDDIEFTDPALPEEFHLATVGLLEELYRMGKLFEAIDKAIRPENSPHGDDEPFVPSHYSPASLYNRLDISDKIVEHARKGRWP